MRTPDGLRKRGLTGITSNLEPGYCVNVPGRMLLECFGPEIQQCIKKIRERNDAPKTKADGVGAEQA